MTSAPNAVDTHNAVGAHDAPTNALVALVAEGQSIWLDFISRDLVRGGQLRRLIEQDGLRGMTSNPSIFQKAIAAGDAYDEQLAQLAAEGKTAGEIFEALSVLDVREACGLFRPLYDQTAGLDGVVSIEVSPRLAHDAQGTLIEARRLWASVDRPNVLIKVPGTDAGATAAAPHNDEVSGGDAAEPLAVEHQRHARCEHRLADDQLAAAGDLDDDDRIRPVRAGHDR